MNTIRTAMTVFLLTIVASTVFGWRWTSSLPKPKMEGAHFVLALAGFASLCAVAILWSARPRKST